MGGIFGGDKPEYKAPTMDPGYYKQAEKAYKEMKDFSPSDYQREQSEKYGQAKSLQSPLKQYGPSNQIISDAVAAKAAKTYGEGASAFKRNTEFQSIAEKQNRIQRANAYAMKVNSIVSTMSQRRMMEEANNFAIRSQVLGSIFGSLGSIGGFAAAGGFKSNPLKSGNVGPGGEVVDF